MRTGKWYSYRSWQELDHERLYIPCLVERILLYRKIGFHWRVSRNGSLELYPHSRKTTMVTSWKINFKMARLETGRAFKVCCSNDPDVKLWSLLFFSGADLEKWDFCTSPSTPCQRLNHLIWAVDVKCGYLDLLNWAISWLILSSRDRLRRQEKQP